jgi:membrane associated rhomboid family serine protease
MWIVSKEAIAAIVRTIVPMIYGWLFTLLGGIDFLSSFIGFIPSEPTAGFVAAVSGAVAGVLYIAIRALAEKWSFIGYFLVINQAPHYDE